MKIATLDGVTLEYEAVGTGAPVLLITGAHMADGYLPLLSQPGLAGRYTLIRYHKRGLAGSTHTPAVVSMREHATDGARLLEYLGVGPAHVVGHSSGGAIALQLALDRPEMVHSLILLEPAILAVPGAEAFFAKAGASIQAYEAGDRARAVALFLSAVSGLEWDTCRATIDTHVPGGVAQAIEDADTFFTSELPALQAWTLEAGQAARICQPVRCVLGTRTEPLFVEATERLRQWLPRAETCLVEGLGHLLHMQDPGPIARGIAEFCDRHPIHAPVPSAR